MVKFRMKYIGENLVHSKNAGSKARTDIETILHGKYDCLFNINAMPTSGSAIKNILRKVKYFVQPDNLKSIYELKKRYHTTIILQYPFYYNRIHNQFARKFIENNNVIIFIHDIDSLRHFGNANLENEITLLNKARVVVVHNHFMKDILRSHGLTTEVVELELFDYILNKEPDNSQGRIHFGNQIVFAGNLQKSGFLPLLANVDDKLTWNLYGNGIPSSLKDKSNIHWKGSYGPDEVPFMLEGSFGLVWDGNSLDGCKGSMGNYLKYNNPHKLSLYIASGLPVITWSEAAIAEFVKKERIGFCVKSLTDIPAILAGLTDEEYDNYIRNIKVLQRRVIHGFYTHKALEEINRFITGESVSMK